MNKLQETKKVVVRTGAGRKYHLGTMYEDGCVRGTYCNGGQSGHAVAACPFEPLSKIDCKVCAKAAEKKSVAETAETLGESATDAGTAERKKASLLRKADDAMNAFWGDEYNSATLKRLIRCVCDSTPWHPEELAEIISEVAAEYDRKAEYAKP